MRKKKVLDLTTTKLFARTLEAFIDPNIRHIISYGGTSSSKSISIYQILLLYALKNPNKRIAIIGESHPVLKRNAINDLKSIVMKELWDDNRFNKSELIYRFPNGSVFQFLSASNPDSFRGYRSDVAYFDEISNIPKESFDQITMRCKHKVLSSFNPTSEFWIVKDEMSDKRNKVIKSTYLDNDYLDERIINVILEKGRKSKRFQNVYVEGNFGSFDGLIFEEDVNWNIVEELPENYKWRLFGLDFGFTNDPTVLIEARFYNSELYIKEHFHQYGMMTQEIIDYVKETLNNTDIIHADNSEPREIETIRQAGIFIKGVKYPVMSSINRLQDVQMNIDIESPKIISELRNYAYIKDKKNGKSINKPIDDFNHCIDALRYAVSEKLMVKADTGMRVVSL